MLKYYKTLEEALFENHFDVKNTNIVGNHLMSSHLNTGKIYISHYNITDKGCTIDQCKAYDTKEAALLVMIGLLVGEYQNEH
jgi:hypothetical protein